MSAIYTCDQCCDSGYIRTTPPVQACPYCEQGRRVSDMLSGESPVNNRQRQRSFSANKFSGQRPRAAGAQAPRGAVSPQRQADSRTEEWTPAQVETVLKVVLYTGAALAFYFLTNRNAVAPEADVPELPDEPARMTSLHGSRKYERNSKSHRGRRGPQGNGEE